MKYPIPALLILLTMIALTACNNNPKPDKEKEEPQVEAVSPKSKYVEKATIIGGAKARMILESKITDLEAEAYNLRTDSLKKAYEQDSSNLSLNFELGTYYSSSAAFEEDPVASKTALEILSKVIEEEPKYKDGAAYFNRAQVQLYLKQWDAAKADIEQYLKIDPQPAASSLLTLATIALEKEETEKLCAYLEEYKTAISGWNSYLETLEKDCK